MSMKRGGHPSLVSIAHSAARFTVSNPLVRSMTVLLLLSIIIHYMLSDPVQHDTGQISACNAEEAHPNVAVTG